MVRLRLLPRDARFFDYFEQSAATMQRAAAALGDLLTHPDEMTSKLQRVRDLEHESDQATEAVMTALNQTFITPLDREDITALIDQLDEVTDGVWAAASRLDVYAIRQSTPTADALVQVLVRQAEALNHALPLLRRRGDMGDIAAHTAAVDDLEREADDLFREALRGLFHQPASPDDIVMAIKWRDIYERLEIATDRAKDVAKILDGLVLKHG